MDRKISRQLSLVDWDFVLGDEPNAAGLHWYPGTFVPGLPAAIIEGLTSERDIVLDPYSGVGTTAIAAVVRGRAAVCCEFNPIAAMSSFVAVGMLALRAEKLPLFDFVFQHTRHLVEAASQLQPRLMLGRDTEQRAIDKYISGITGIAPTRLMKQIFGTQASVAVLGRWYHPTTLSHIRSFIHRVKLDDRSGFIQLFALTMMSAIARPLSSQTRSWGHIADNVYPKELSRKDLSRAAIVWLNRTYSRSNALAPSTSLPRVRPFFTLRIHDWSSPRSVRLPLGKAQLLLTSPPYAGAIDYILSQRLSLYLLGYSEADISAIGKSELGARRKRFDPAHIHNWAADLASATERQLPLLSTVANAVFVMPHKDHGRELGEERIRELMEASGFSLAFSSDRSIRQARARQFWTSIKRESILIFERT